VISLEAARVGEILRVLGGGSYSRGRRRARGR
jgi:hypothetical protein